MIIFIDVSFLLIIVSWKNTVIKLWDVIVRWCKRDSINMSVSMYPIFTWLIQNIKKRGSYSQNIWYCTKCVTNFFFFFKFCFLYEIDYSASFLIYSEQFIRKCAMFCPIFEIKLQNANYLQKWKTKILFNQCV